MKIYVTHSRSFDFKNKLYVPIRKSRLNSLHEFILPHEESDEPYDSKTLIMCDSLDLLLAEVSYKSTAQGVELGWADSRNTPIALLYDKDLRPSNSLRRVSNLWVPYSNEIELVEGIERAILSI